MDNEHATHAGSTAVVYETRSSVDLSAGMTNSGGRSMALALALALALAVVVVLPLRIPDRPQCHVISTYCSRVRPCNCLRPVEKEERDRQEERFECTEDSWQTAEKGRGKQRRRMSDESLFTFMPEKKRRYAVRREHKL